MRLFGSFVAALIAIVLVTLASVVSLRSWKTSNEEVLHTHEVRTALDTTLLMALNAETGQRGFLLTGRDDYLDPYRLGVAELQSSLDRLGSLTHDNPAQQKSLAGLRAVLRERLAVLDEGIAARRAGDAAKIDALYASARGKQLMDEARVILGRMIAEETRLLELREQAWQAQQRKSLAIALAGAAVLIVLTLAAAAVVRGDLRRREQIERQRARVFEYQERLTGIVSHDLRNPLTAILFSVKGLLRKPEQLAPEVIASLQRAERSASRIQALTALLIDYTHARIGRGLPTTRSPLDVRALVERTIEELRGANPAAAILLDARTSEQLALWDGERIAQLVSNLVSNALRYGKPGGAVTVTLTDTAPEAIEIAVHNEGPPIAKELIPSLFEPYKRGDGADQASNRGLGLGLYIVREIVQAHGGEIEVRSTETDGTAFIARLPRRPADAAGQPASVPPQPAVPGAESGIIVRLTAAG